MKTTKWKIGLLSLFLSTSFIFNSFTEWQQAQDGSWKFYNVDGTIGINKWAKSGEDWYHFDNEGNMEYSTIVVDGDGTYYVDGITAEWIAYNNTGKTIKYYSIDLVFINPVNDPAFDEITGAFGKTINYVGPVAPGDKLVLYTKVGYIPAVSKIVMVNINLEYTDGTKETVNYGYELYELS